MGAAIRTRIVKIGNSQGVRIPKVLLEQSGIHAEVEIEVQGDHLTIRMSQASDREGLMLISLPPTLVAFGH